MGLFSQLQRILTGHPGHGNDGTALRLPSSAPRENCQMDEPSSVESEQGVDQKVALASQWQLIRWKFAKHRMAVVGLVVLIVFYLAAIFAEFVAPSDARRIDTRYGSAPPHQIHFVDSDGRFHLRPFIYRFITQRDPVSLRKTFIEDPTQALDLGLFVHGDPYELWGMIPGDVHLFGVVDQSERVYFLGADKAGRDVLSLIIYGSRISLSIGLLGVLISFILGIIAGGISGFYGGVIDLIIQRIIEFIISVPSLPLWMALSVALPPTWSQTKVYLGIVIILSLIGWTSVARVVRGKFMSLREEEFVMAAQLHGAGDGRVIFVHLLPAFLSHIIAALTLAIPGMILGETALSFLGLGLQRPAISWGVLLKDAQSIKVLAEMPWLIYPGLALIIAVLAFNFVGDGLRDAADPYSTA